MNTQLINNLRFLSSLDKKDGKPFQSKAFDKSADKIRDCGIIINTADDIISLKLGKTTTKFCLEYLETGKMNKIEKAKSNPKYQFVDIYGVGPKKAEELVTKHRIKSMEELKKKQNDVLNDVQKIGLKYYDDILKRIPRKEIVLYEKKMRAILSSINFTEDIKMEIVGSYRRGLDNSGDIDVIITSNNPKSKVFEVFLDLLESNKIIKEFLSKGSKKSLTVGKLRGKPARRIDFLFCPQEEYSFATLYFTGSKHFNTFMRARANALNLTLNEHGLYEYVKRKKGKKISGDFDSEEAICKYLGVKYLLPIHRENKNNFELI